jgi:hypothetical protein
VIAAFIVGSLAKRNFGGVPIGGAAQAVPE